MSDFEIRRLQRAYEADGTPEAADRLIAALTRAQAGNLEEDPEFPDMACCSYWLGELFDEDYDYEDMEFQLLTLWIERNASFSHNSEYHWEHMLYLGNIDDRDSVATAFTSRESPWATDATPGLLIPVIEAALDRGIQYLSLYYEA